MVKKNVRKIRKCLRVSNDNIALFFVISKNFTTESCFFFYRFDFFKGVFVRNPQVKWPIPIPFKDVF